MGVRDANAAKFGFEIKELDAELRVASLRGSEGMSRLFGFELALACEDPDVDFAKAVNQPAVITIEGQDETRQVHGIVRRFELHGQGKRYTHYHAWLVPKLWWLHNRQDCRIFQEKNVREIIEQVLSDAGLTQDDYRFSLEENYPKRTYCVQYRETDLAFIERLMEEEGIFYYFEHDENKHTLVIGDSSSAYGTIPGDDTLPYVPPTGTVPDMEHVSRFIYSEGVTPGEVVLRDYNFKKPGTDLGVTGDVDQYAELSIYDYPGRYDDADRGKAVNNIRLQALVAGRKHASGTTASARMAPGHQFVLDKHPREGLNQKYLITHVEHDGLEPQALEEENAGRDARYSNEFGCIPQDVVLRPERKTPKPFVEGPQTAIVVGPSDEEIYTDEYGQVKVQFHWDRLGRRNEHSSCWIRVSQAWAGNGWGAMCLPRIGQEVIVDFLGGDPDRPIITGRLYHGTNRPPYKLPDGKTTSTFKSTTTPDGGGFNEIRFEDKKGKEQIYMHGERNLDILVKANLVETIGNNAHLKVAKNRYERVEHDLHTTVDNDLFEKTGNDRHLTVTGKQAIEIGASSSMTVKGDVLEVFKANHSEKTTNNYYLRAMGVVIESMTGMTFKCGGNHIVINPSGVTIKGTAVTIDGAMARIASGPGSPPSAGKAKQAVAPAPPEKPQEQKADEKPYKKDESKESWVEIELVDEDNNPVQGERYKITMPDGSVKTGTLDENGYARVDGIDPGTCKVTFPNLDKDAWEKA